MGNRLKQLRTEQKLSLKELSNELSKSGYNISADSLSKYERAERKPKLEKIIELASFFNVSISYLQGASNIKDANVFSNFENMVEYFEKKNGDHGDQIWMDKDEVPNFFTEQNIRRAQLFKKLFIVNGNLRGKELREYEEIFDEFINQDTTNADEIYFYLEHIFQIILKDYKKDQKAEETKKQITSVLYDYLGLDEDDF